MRSTYEQGLDRPIVGAVAIDPAHSGPCGLAVGRWADGPWAPAGWQGDVFSTAASRWLGDAVTAVCRPGERLVLLAESTAFRSLSVARLLGIAVGVVEGLLIDLNAIEPHTRVDVPASVWRRKLGIAAPRGDQPRDRRTALKLQAVEYARNYISDLAARDHDLAEAVCILDYGRLNRENPKQG